MQLIFIHEKKLYSEGVSSYTSCKTKIPSAYPIYSNSPYNYNYRHNPNCPSFEMIQNQIDKLETWDLRQQRKRQRQRWHTYPHETLVLVDCNRLLVNFTWRLPPCLFTFLSINDQDSQAQFTIKAQLKYVK